jgi:short-subunit dehydrogenase
MPRTIAICGYGPGISDGVARRFGREGFQVALVARNAARVEAGAKALGEAGITAKGFVCDLGDTAAVERLVADVRAQLGPITVLHWNPSAGVAGDIVTRDVAELRTAFDVGVNGLVAAIQKSLPDMKAQKDAAILVTGGGIGQPTPQVDQMAVRWNTIGIAVVKAAQHKLVRTLHHKLANDGIYVGEVMVVGSVKGTSFDRGQATIDPAAVADQFWAIYRRRSEASIQFRG